MLDTHPERTIYAVTRLFDGEKTIEENEIVEDSGHFRSVLLAARAATHYKKSPVSQLHLDFVVETRCTLRCRHCNNLMQFYDTSQHKQQTIDELKTYADHLFATIPYVGQICVLGGETLLYPELDQFLDHLVKYRDQYGDAHIFTNGTIQPSQPLLDSLRRNRFLVEISKYDSVPEEKRKAVKASLVENNVNWCETSSPWKANEASTPHHRDEATLQQVFSGCLCGHCRSYYRGELHICPRSAHGTDLGLIEKNEDDFFDLNKEWGHSLTEQALRFLAKPMPSIAACDICNYSYNFTTEVTAGDQIKKD
ncbi:MAG: radical SAM protein [Puniceicoccales bacterium]|jgi:organic radical activating enzyme|nr:radical SAM protein [Puniceicoccales bacterium]